MHQRECRARKTTGFLWEILLEILANNAELAIFRGFSESVAST
jgi:hypothetical protein